MEYSVWGAQRISVDDGRVVPDSGMTTSSLVEIDGLLETTGDEEDKSGKMVRSGKGKIDLKHIHVVLLSLIMEYKNKFAFYDKVVFYDAVKIL